MQPSRVLFYIDSASTLNHCVNAAEILRQQLPARIVMMVVDSAKHKSGLLGYEVYDYAALFASRARFKPEWGATEELRPTRQWARHLPRLRLGITAIWRKTTRVRPTRQWARHLPRLRLGTTAIWRKTTRVGLLAGMFSSSQSLGSRLVCRLALLVGRIIHVAARPRRNTRSRLTRSLITGAAIPLSPFPTRTIWRKTTRIGSLAGMSNSSQSLGGRLVCRVALVGRLVRVAARPCLDTRTKVRLARALIAVAIIPLSPVLVVDRLSPSMLRQLRRWSSIVRKEVEQLRCSAAWTRLQRLSYWLRAVRGVRRFVAYVRPDVIVLPEDNIETLSRAFVVYGLRWKIPTVVIPYTVPNPLEPAQFYFDNPEHLELGSLAHFITWLRPKWRFVHAGRSLLRLNPAKAFAIEALGLSTPAPWVLNRGSAAAIVLDSEAQRDHYLALGFPTEQLRVIGDTYGNQLALGLRQAPQRRAELMAELGMAPDRLLIVCAFPPDQYGGASTRSFEFPTFQALVEAWMQGFHQVGQSVNVIIRPHPRLDLAKLATYERPNLRISLRPTIDLVPISDLYVASISATIRWAIACGVPVINYDTYHYRYGDYAGVGGIVHIESFKEFLTAMLRYVNDPGWAAYLKRQQVMESARWGIVDDGFAERLSRLVAELSPRIASKVISATGVHTLDIGTAGKQQNTAASSKYVESVPAVTDYVQ